MVMEQWFSPSKAVLVFILATFTGGLSSTAVANLPAGAVIRATPGIVYINITGNVIAPPPCLINDGKMIEVNFGEVMSTRINDSNYKQPIEYTATCQKRPTNAMKVYITGNATGFYSNALQTNITGLGVRILYQGKLLGLGSAVKFTYPNLPKLEAIPVRDNRETLVGGDFVANATLHVDYQ